MDLSRFWERLWLTVLANVLVGVASIVLWILPDPQGEDGWNRRKANLDTIPDFPRPKN